MLERLGRRLTSSVLAWDVIVTLLVLYGTSLLRLRLEYGQDLTQQQVQLSWQLYVAVAMIWTTSFLLLTPQRALFFGTLIEAIGRMLASVALAVLVFAGVLYLTFRDVSRLQFAYFAVVDLVALIAIHLAVWTTLSRRNRNSSLRRTLIVGSGIQAKLLLRELQRRPWSGATVLGRTGDQTSEADSPPLLGSIGDTARIVDEHRIDEVIFVTQQEDEIARISLQLMHRPVMLHMVPSVLDLAFARTPVESLGGIPLISLRESALSEPQRVFKRLFDMLGSALLLLLLSPVMLLIAAAIRLDSPGPIFFTQERIGEHGRRFRMIKFRSMYRDAERRWHDVAMRDARGHLVHKRTDDPRITPIGQRLRRTSLDELPQLFNVLRGEMSLVGPRPEMPYVAQEYEPWQWQRFRIPPGMTGWWQVNGRSDKLMHLNTEDDLYYIQNYSFWLDLKILWMTLGVVLRREGAY